MNQIEQLIQAIPKAELHCHIEGTLEPEMMFHIAQRNKIKLPFANPTEVRAAYQFNNLQSFLDIYHQGAHVLHNEEDFYDLTWAYLNRVKKDNVCHCEIFFVPQVHTTRGIPFKVVISGIDRALQDAKQKLNISNHLILGIARHLSEEDAIATFKQALPFKEKIIALGLESSEANNPPKKFQNVFNMAKEEGFLAVSHAGEEGPAEYIWQALELLHAKRIDHGVHCTQDEKLVDFLKEKQIPLTMCPLSNVKLRVFNVLADHNLKTLLHKGLRITINSDDPAYFGGYIVDNFRAAYQSLKLNSDDIIQLAKNSIYASFISDEQKNTYLKEIDAVIKKLNI